LWVGFRDNKLAERSNNRENENPQSTTFLALSPQIHLWSRW
jgi:hypothetical protein